MKPTLKIIVSVLLFINSIGAIFGGANLIDHPDGSSLQLSPDWLKHTPFDDYLVPGVVLFITNGLLGFIVLATLFLGFRKYPLFVIAQGVILCGWLIVQVVLIRTIIGLHLFTFTIGVSLILMGLILARIERVKIKWSTV